MQGLRRTIAVLALAVAMTSPATADEWLDELKNALGVDQQDAAEAETDAVPDAGPVVDDAGENDAPVTSGEGGDAESMQQETE